MHRTHILFIGLLCLALSACSDDASVEDPTPEGEFAPSEDVTLSGVQSFEAVHIPPGVTVTAAGELVLRGRTGVEIEGTLVSAGHAIEVQSDSSIQVTGTIRNALAVGERDTAGIRIVARGDIRISGARIESAGDVLIQNDPALTDADFPDSSGTAPEGAVRQAAQQGEVIWVQVFENCFIGYESQPVADSGTAGLEGGVGARGRDIVVKTRGYVQFLGGVVVAAQDGGCGGEGRDQGFERAIAKGGRGGRGGNVVLHSTREMYFTGSNRIRSGRGGDGGPAEAIGQERDGRAVAASAQATGGRGYDSGIIDIRARLGILIEGPLRLEVGVAGTGGSAVAHGANGKDAGTQDAQRGGSAEAQGGAGAPSPDRRLIRRDVGGLELLTVAGGDGGDGGSATAVAGIGGVGNEQHPTGGAGGDMTSTGGDGGGAKTRNHRDEPMGRGGDGGAVVMAGGHGGAGRDDCEDPCRPVEGGVGGRGGDGIAEDGDTGAAGIAPGVFGGVTIESAGNGGPGGNGRPPASGGPAGNRIVRNRGAVLDPGPSFSPGEDGDLCPVLFGACCSEGGACAVLSCVACEEQDGTFVGVGTDCDPNPCEADPTGACCATDGSCTVTVSSACGGQWSMGAGCDPKPCATADGACCAPTGVCTIRNEAACISLGHDYLGDGVWCAPNPCTQPPAGACCNAFAGCSMQTETACTASGSTYMGDGVECNVYPCFVGCCYVDGSCQYVSGTECLATDGLVSGPDCDPRPCPASYGACCSEATGACGILDPIRCAYYGGVYLGDGVACGPTACDEGLRGACCFTDGSCTMTRRDECTGYFWGYGSRCDPNPCPQPEGACCLLQGGCFMAIQNHCGSETGTWLGPNTTCTPDPCSPGACCLETGYCLQISQPNCTTGTWLGVGVACDPNPCPEPPAACCRLDGSCTMTDEAGCTAIGGEWWEHTYTCAPNPCPQPSGACCMTDGQCIERHRDGCRPDEGVYMGDGTTCGPGPCVPGLGACCLGQNECVLVDGETACDARGGLWLGAGVRCLNPASCLQLGACCLPGGECRVTSIAQCPVGFEGFGTVCDPNPCTGGRLGE